MLITWIFKQIRYRTENIKKNIKQSTKMHEIPYLWFQPLIRCTIKKANNIQIAQNTEDYFVWKITKRVDLFDKFFSVFAWYLFTNTDWNFVQLHIAVFMLSCCNQHFRRFEQNEFYGLSSNSMVSLQERGKIDNKN